MAIAVTRGTGTIVSRNLQILTVAAAGLFWMVQAGTTLYYAIHAKTSFVGDYNLLIPLSWSLVPFVLFCVAFWYVGNRGSGFGRLFYAVLVSVAVSILNLAIQQLFAFYPAHGLYNAIGNGGTWLYVVAALTVYILAIVFMVVRKLGRTRAS